MTKRAWNAVFPILLVLIIISALPALACEGGFPVRRDLTDSDLLRVLSTTLELFSCPPSLLIIGLLSFFSYWRHASKSMNEACGISLLTVIVLVILLRSCVPAFLMQCCALTSDLPVETSMQFFLGLSVGLTLLVASIQTVALKVYSTKIRLGLRVWVTASSFVVAGAASIVAVTVATFC